MDQGMQWAPGTVAPGVARRPLSGPVALLHGFLLRWSGVAALEEPGGDDQEGSCVSGEE